MSKSQKLNVLISSYLEPELVDRMRADELRVEVIFEPELLGKPSYPCDHSSLPKRTPEEETRWRNLLGKADVLFDFDHTHREDLPELAPNLRWIQATSAGIGQFVKRYNYDTRTNWIFTTASGVHSRPLAEFVMMSILMFSKDAFHLAGEKEKHSWNRYCGEELVDKRLVIVGLGRIGREVARVAKTFDMRVFGSRHGNGGSKVEVSAPHNVDSTYGPGELGAMLGQADYLCISCPHTPETEGLIGKKEIEMMPQGSVLINVSRGAVVDQVALTAALKSGHLRGAALDVFAIEPLPEDDPLWDMPNVIISPHSASTVLSENSRLVSLFSDNLKRYLAGQPLRNVLDTKRLY